MFDRTLQTTVRKPFELWKVSFAPEQKNCCAQSRKLMNCENVKFAVWKKTTLLFTHTLTKVPAYNEGKPQLHLSSWSLLTSTTLQLQPIFSLSRPKKNQSQKTTWLKFAEKTAQLQHYYFRLSTRRLSLLQKTDQKHEKTQLHNYFDKNNTTKSHARNWVFKFKILDSQNFQIWTMRVPEMCFRLPAQAASVLPRTKSPSNKWCV